MIATPTRQIVAKKPLYVTPKLELAKHTQSDPQEKAGQRHFQSDFDGESDVGFNLVDFSRNIHVFVKWIELSL